MEKNYSLDICQLRRSVDFIAKVSETFFLQAESKIKKDYLLKIYSCFSKKDLSTLTSGANDVWT